MSEWIRMKDEFPPSNVPLLVLVDGTVREGYIDEILLLGQVLPTKFQTIHYPERDQWKDQHSSFGFDPYWMLCPAKPVQERDTRVHEEGVLRGSGEAEEHEQASFEFLLTLENDVLAEVARCYVQGSVQKRAREILHERGFGWGAL